MISEQTDDHPAIELRGLLRRVIARLVKWEADLLPDADPAQLDKVLRAFAPVVRTAEMLHGALKRPSRAKRGEELRREDDELRARLESALASVCDAGAGEGRVGTADEPSALPTRMDAQ